MENIFHTIIEEICKELGIKYTLLSRDWIYKLEYNNKIRFISGYKFGLNDHALGEIIDDKFALYEILKDEVPIIEHNILYNKDNNSSHAIGYNDYSKVMDYFKLKGEIVLKANAGTCGHSVYHINNIDDIQQTLENLFIKNYSISYCPYYEIKNEYRVIILKGKEKLIYKKERPSVIGNGINTIKELLIEFNPSYFKDREYSEDYDRILQKNEVFNYNWKFNLSGGARAAILEDKKIIKELRKITEKITSKIDVGFASIDIIETKDGFYVMEMNSGVMMKNICNMIDINIVKNIYKEAIIELFK